MEEALLILAKQINDGSALRVSIITSEPSEAVYESYRTAVAEWDSKNIALLETIFANTREPLEYRGPRKTSESFAKWASPDLGSRINSLSRTVQTRIDALSSIRDRLNLYPGPENSQLVDARAAQTTHPAPTSGEQRSSRPKIFILSSSEGRGVADALHVSLPRTLEVTTWYQDVFRLSKFTLETLEEYSSKFDYAAFVFWPDDIVTTRGQTKAAVRDNVIFELGLFIGKLGRNRCFILAPYGTNVDLLSDIQGFTITYYEANRSDGNWEAAVTRAVLDIRHAIEAVK